MLNIRLKEKLFIFNKNFIYRKLNKNIKNKYKIINTRIAPEPNGFLHLGNFKSFYINNKISKIYNGNYLIKIDDTNPVKEKKIYKKNILKIIKTKKKNIKNNIKKNINFNSFNNHKLKQYTKLFIKKKIVKINKNFNKIQRGFFKEKKPMIIINLKKKFIKIYRLKYIKHYKTKYNYFLHSLYDYSNILWDKITNINYSFCSIEFKKKNFFYKWINNKFIRNIKNKQIEFNRINLNEKNKKTEFIKYLKNKYIKNQKDIRSMNLITFRKKLINDNLIYFFFEKLNINKKIRNLKINYFNLLLNKNSKKYFTIKNLFKIIIKKFKNIIKKKEIIILKYLYKSIKIKKKKILIKKYLKINKIKLILNIIKKRNKKLIVIYKIKKKLNINKLKLINKYNKIKIILLNLINNKLFWKRIYKINFYTKNFNILKKKLFNNYKIIKIRIRNYILLNSALNDLNV